MIDDDCKSHKMSLKLSKSIPRKNKTIFKVLKPEYIGKEAEDQF